MKSVYCAVRTGSLNKAVCILSLKRYLIFASHFNIIRCAMRVNDSVVKPQINKVTGPSSLFVSMSGLLIPYYLPVQDTFLMLSRQFIVERDA